MEKVLLQKKEFVGKYVAIRSASNNEVIARGANPCKVRERALKKGIKEPLVFFVSESEETVARCY